jgi:hypothetical protein
METKALLYDLNTSYGLDLQEVATMETLEALLAERVNDMINGDFSALVRLLYRIDVSESKLRQLLQENTTMDADRTIARLILERQWQKIITRKKYSQRDPMQGATGDEEDRW